MAIRVVSVHNYIGQVLSEVDEVMLLDLNTPKILSHPSLPTPYSTPSSSISCSENNKHKTKFKLNHYISHILHCTYSVEIFVYIFAIQVYKNAYLFVFWLDV